MRVFYYELTVVTYNLNSIVLNINCYIIHFRKASVLWGEYMASNVSEIKEEESACPCLPSVRTSFRQKSSLELKTNPPYGNQEEER